MKFKMFDLGNQNSDWEFEWKFVMGVQSENWEFS